MEIIIGKYSGFCAGVNNTYLKAKEEVKKGNLYCLGDIIHNELVIDELKKEGITFVNNINEVPDNNRVIFRAHGEIPENYEYARNHHIEVIDLTCPNVSIIHKKVLNHKDCYVLLIGKKNHPEVIATFGYCKPNGYIIESEDDIKDAYDSFIKSGFQNIYIVSQTTFSSKLFDALVDNIQSYFKIIDIIVDKTICLATEKRQEEAIILSKECNKMIVIGSKNSSNTKELYNIAISNCNESYFVENEDDLLNINFDDKDKIGILAGASVPSYFIDYIVNKIKETH